MQVEARLAVTISSGTMNQGTVQPFLYISQKTPDVVGMVSRVMIYCFCLYLLSDSFLLTIFMSPAPSTYANSETLDLTAVFSEDLAMNSFSISRCQTTDLLHLRLAFSYENGFGPSNSSHRAFEWYRGCERSGKKDQIHVSGAAAHCEIRELLMSVLHRNIVKSFTCLRRSISSTREASANTIMCCTRA